MKIYNEVVTRFNETTGKWETISEDSYQYNGNVALAQGIPPNASPINSADTIADTVKTTTGYFTRGDGTLSGTSIFTGSLSATNENYYFNVNNLVETDSDSEVQFSVTYGHAAGSGSDTYGDSADSPTTLKGQAEAIYKQLSETLQLSTEVTGGFKISQQGSAGAISSGVRDDYVYALIGRRSRFKDRMNKKSWTLLLSGSTSDYSGSILTLTDDSKTTPAVATPAGPRYNIVSGALGVVSGSGYTHKTFGWFYPEMGLMLFSGAQLSASIPGAPHFGTPILPVTASKNSIYFTKTVLNDAANPFVNIVPGQMCFFATSSLTPFTSTNMTASHAFKVLDNGLGTGLAWIKEDVGGTTVHDKYTITASVKWPNTGEATATGSLYPGISTTKVTASFDTVADTALSTRVSSSGFAPALSAKGNANNALRFVNCMKNVGGSVALRLRSEEDQTQENYFCRIKATEYNFSSNHTFVSGSKNKIRNKDMHGNPQTFITGVGLYNSSGQLLAIARLSSPLKKNFASEATIKVKLTY